MIVGDWAGHLRARIVPELDLESCPAGQLSRLLVEISQDGMGAPVSVPVAVLRGRRPGPVFGVTAALHGNELNGIPVIHQLLERVDPFALRGTLVAAIAVNPPGLIARRRRFDPEADLNLSFPGEADGSSAQVFAHRLMDRVVRHFDFLVDLHTASFGRANSLYVRADLDHPISARMAELQRPQIILHNPPHDRTLRGAAMANGIPAITVEIGDPHRFQKDFIRRSIGGIRAVMAELGLVPRRKASELPAPVICSSSVWLYTDAGGLLQVHPELAARVRAGEIVARLTNIFGDTTREYRAPSDGVVIGRSVEPVGNTGARVLHLGIPRDA